ncbi:hypothetical protein [Flavisphingomonas formosensis]|uniref:hypothetical protein n=1 Tax=Flavisphingomonas formosensis TaxID=861534 RepID=UPI0012FBE892|nr:hypothetical protein [Sphingomonas formosensis]
MIVLIAAATLAATDTAPAADPLVRCSAAVHAGFLDAETACLRPKETNPIWGDGALSFACADALDFARGLAKSARGLPVQTLAALIKGYDERAAICHGVVEPPDDHRKGATPWN